MTRVRATFNQFFNATDRINKPLEGSFWRFYFLFPVTIKKRPTFSKKVLSK